MEHQISQEPTVNIVASEILDQLILDINWNVDFGFDLNAEAQVALLEQLKMINKLLVIYEHLLPLYQKQTEEADNMLLMRMQEKGSVQ